MPIAPRALAGFALLVSVALPASAQQAVVPYFTPNPAREGTNVRMTFELPRPGCGESAYPTITRTGFAIRVDYQLSDIVICGVPPPTTFVFFDLGGFPPGNYTVTAVGTDFPTGPLPVVTGGFGVLPAASNVPAVSRTAALLLAFGALLAGALMLARKRKPGWGGPKS